MEIKVMTNVLQSNDDLAKTNQRLFDQHKVFCINLMGSPGAGKTTLLENTLKLLTDKLNVAVIEGDIYTDKDAERIEATGVPVVQINTGGACHLDAGMVNKVLGKFDFNAMDLMIVENVGNLVCPVEFSVGEHQKIAVLSIIEGEDKPLKYPLIFKESTAAVLSKVDLAELCEISIENIKRDILSINPQIKIFEVASRKGQGLPEFANWLISQCPK